jgi:hypothetical protein
MFFPTIVFYQMCVTENAQGIDGNTTLVQYIISLIIRSSSQSMDTETLLQITCVHRVCWH